MNACCEGAVTAGPATPKGRGARRRARPGSWRRALRPAAALLVAALFLLPVYVAAVTSLSTAAHVFVYPPHLLPDWDFAAYVRVWHMARWPMYFGNTLRIALLTVGLTLTTSLLAAYALAFLRFRGREVVFGLVLLVLVVPGEALLIPNYIVLYHLGLINTYAAQILPFAGSAFGIFLLRQFFLTLPRSYLDAARVDGAGHLRCLCSIALPLAAPVLTTIGLYTLIGVWNSFQWPLIVTVSHQVQPIEVAVSRLMQAHSVDWRRLSAAGTMATLPLIAAFLVLQPHILRGIGRGEGLQG